MDKPKTIGLKALAAGAAWVLALEFAAALIAPQKGLAGLWALAGLRVLQAGGLVAGFVLFYRGLEAIFLAPGQFKRGLLRGLLWGAGFGGLCALGGIALWATGINPIALFAGGFENQSAAYVFSYILVGSLVAGISEEIFFRGLVQGFFLRFGAGISIAASTAIFTAAHWRTGVIPVFQIIGGLLFSCAFAREKNLYAPIVLHVGGNFALLALSVWGHNLLL
ncbi:MAG: type II CAAX endopeptidase family protein [Desulfatibacillaceae bacterium]|nr:type II CAAX endopeptidase family protein [Desulfatibacillaceae bacterium]